MTFMWLCLLCFSMAEDWTWILFQDMVAYRGGGTYARNPGSSAQGAEEEEEEDGEEDEEEEEDE